MCYNSQNIHIILLLKPVDLIMTRQKHDQYSKQFVAELLKSQGSVTVNYEICPGEAHHADLYFKPHATADFHTLGLLGKIAAHPSLLEPFRKPPTKIEFQICLQKLFTLRSELLNEFDRYKKSLPEDEKVKPLPEDELPHLWILATSVSDNSLNFLGVKPKRGWCDGVYFSPDAFRTAIVSINQLPKTPDTLLLRLLGKGATQQQAINEIRAFPADSALRNQIGRAHV